MNQAHPDIETIFWAAIELASPEERAAFLDQACAGDSALKARVNTLIEAHLRAGDFLEFPIPPVATNLTEDSDFRVPTTDIGPYKLRELLGEGGMGSVYVAEQEKPIRRKVALKVVKAGMDTREVIGRFEAERQALALMDHPNIAKVFDAGTTETGRPYFVMELVRGMPITDYCDRRRLPPRERLKLFITVCQAVQHAHQRGIIHRDLKPSNVMITLHDGVPVPKVIDFGVAKAINQKLTEHTLYTRHAQLVGTPLYMSPEQAELSGLEIDTRSDVYSLGVLLYELLTGQTPFDKETFSKIGYDEMRRMIREDEPPRPSQRISTLAAEARSTVSSKRGTDDRQLARVLHGELDWIVMKTLEKDRTRRYGSADALAADLQRYLDDQPVEACPPSLAYRMRKLIRRKSRAMGATTVLLALLVVAVCGPLAAYAVFMLIWGPETVAPDSLRRDGPLPTADTTKPLPVARVPGRELPGLVPEAMFSPNIGRWQMITKKPRGVMRSAVWSPDENSIALGEANHVRIYDALTLHLLHVLVGHARPVRSVAWNPDGDRLASASEDGTVRLWTRAGAPTHLLEGHSAAVYQVAWSPNGAQLASSSADGTVRLWNADGSVQRVLEEPGRHVFAIDWSPDGKLLASAGGDIRTPAADGSAGENGVRLWEAETGVLIRRFGGDEKHAALCLDWRPDGKQLAVGYGDVYRSVLGASTLTPVPDAGIRLWNVDGTRVLKRSREAESNTAAEFGTIYAVAWRPDGSQLAFGSRLGVVRIWHADDGRISDIKSENLRDLHCLSWKRDGGLLTTSRESIREWNVDRGITVLVQGLSEQRFLYVKWSPDGKLISSAGLFWNADGTPVKRPDRPTGNRPAWWENETQNQRPDGSAAPKVEGPYPAMREWAWNKNGWLAGATWADAAARIWNDQGKLVATLKDHRGGVESVSWSPEGDWLASGGGDSVRLWRPDGTPGPVITGHTDEVYAVAWSPDGQWIASAGTDSTIRFWKPDGKAGPVFRGHQGGLHDLAWSPDSKRIVSGSWLDSTLRVWNIDTGKTEWQALQFDTGAAVTLSATGQPLHGDRGRLETAMLYLLEKPDGTTELMTFSDFRKRFALPFITFYSERFAKVSELDQWDQSEAAFAEALTFLPDGNPSVRSQIIDIGSKLANARHANSDYGRAERTITTVIGAREKLVAEFPDDRDRKYELGGDYVSLGMILGVTGRITESRDMFTKRIDILQKLVESDPENQSYRERLCRTFVARAVRQQNRNESFNDLSKALELDPKSINFAWDIVRWCDDLLHASSVNNNSPGLPAAAAEAQFQLVKEVFQELIQRSPEVPNQHLFADWLTTAPEEFRDPELAIQLARWAVEMNPTDNMCLQSLAWALYRSGDYQGSIETNRRKASFQENEETDFVIAMAHWRLGNHSDARACFDRGNKWLTGYLKTCRDDFWKKNVIHHPTPSMEQRLQAEAAEVLGLSEDW